MFWEQDGCTVGQNLEGGTSPHTQVLHGPRASMPGTVAIMNRQAWSAHASMAFRARVPILQTCIQKRVSTHHMVPGMPTPRSTFTSLAGDADAGTVGARWDLRRGRGGADLGKRDWWELASGDLEEAGRQKSGFGRRIFQLTGLP